MCTEVAGDPQIASGEMDRVMAAQFKRLKQLEREARNQDQTPRVLIVDPNEKGPASSFVMAQSRFFPVEKIWIETRDGRVLGYTPTKAGDFRESLKQRFEERGIPDDLSVIAVRHILHKQKPHVPDEPAEEQHAGVEEAHYGTGNTTHVDHGDRSAPRSESRGMWKASMSFTLAVALLFSELAFAQGASQLVKDLQFGMNSKKTQAMEEIVKRLNPEEGKAPDAEILMKQDEIVKLLLAMVKNPFGGELSAKAVAPLAEFAKRDPALIDLLVQEIKKGTPTSKLQIIRTLAAVGTPAKDAAAADIKALLKDPKLGNDAASALAFFGGPFAPEEMPFIVKGMMLAKDPGVRLNIALKLLENPSALGLYAKYLEPVLSKGIETQVLEEDVRQNILRALVKIGTPNALKTVFDLLLLPSKQQRDRVLAANALSACQPPSPEVLGVLVSAMKTKHFVDMVDAVCDTLMGYGADAQPALSGLRAVRKDPIQSVYKISEERKKQILTKIEKTIKTIEVARHGIAAPAAPVTNPVPPQAAQEVKRSE